MAVVGFVAQHSCPCGIYGHIAHRSFGRVGVGHTVIELTPDEMVVVVANLLAVLR